ncbi:glycine betaine ABC transporter substrate-binding protein [Planococcus sp. X10-3]|uniref:glycine betaine ABC transporter substrate-binding protein n=1 Tax=Planococcus sp. X10-3 TaxID=3061240 RepID=UPI003BB15D83
MKNFNKLFPALSLGTLLLLTACNGDEESGSAEESTEEKGSISIGMNNWAENVAVSNMWKIVLEEKGYDVSLEPVEKAILYEGLSSGDLDIGMEIWLPNTDKSFFDKYEEEIEWRETWYEGTDLALVVPSYMEDINSIEDLKANQELFDSEIIGIDPGSSLMGLTEEVVSEYNLDYDLIPSSEPSMIAELKNRLENEEPIVVTLWKPHWVFAEMDLKILEEPNNIYGDSENILYATRQGLEDDHPEVVEWFDNFMLNDAQLGSLMADLNEADSEQAGAQKWIDENQDLINEWIN